MLELNPGKNFKELYRENTRLKRMLADEIMPLYIDAGCPWQNGYIESFNARLREDCLNREELWTLTEARVVIEDWRWNYNHVRPHRSLGYITPNEFAQDEGGEEAQGQEGLGSGYALPASQR